MNILLVDDDQYIIDTIKNMVNWENIGIDSIYTANNIRQAQNIVERFDIHLMLCDIEMPQGTGLELIEWERVHQDKIQVIFLTSYAEFNYACKAVQLRGFDYLLKPVSYEKLEQILIKAVEKIKEEQKIDEDRETYRQWEERLEERLEERKELFWEKLFSKSIRTRDEIAQEIQKFGLDYNLEEKYIYMVVDIYDYRTIYEKLEHNMYSFVVKNITEEIFSTSHISGECVVWRNTGDAARWNVILKEESLAQKEQLKEICEKYISAIQYCMKSNVGCYLGSTTSIADMPESVEQVQRMYEDCVTNDRKVFFIDEYKFREIQYMEPSFYTWECLLINGDKKGLLINVNRYLDDLAASQEVNKQILHYFRTDFTQMIYNVLHSRQICVHQLFEGEENEAFYINSLKSLERMKEYASRLIRQSLDYVGMTKKASDIVERVKAYIESHMSEEITRNSFSEIVFLNPEYLGKIFKKEEGISLGSYLAQRRVERAKDLFKNTSLSVGKVAVEVGYSNFSYFSKVFRNSTGMNPNEFRKSIKP